MSLKASSTASTMSGSKLMFNADLLKELLGGKTDSKRKKKEKPGSDADRKRKKAKQASKELFQTILKQETGSVAPINFKRWII